MPRTKGYPLGFAPTQLLWEGDNIFIASKRAYMIMNYNDGSLMAKCEIDVRDTPMIAALQDRLLILTQMGKQA